MIKIQYTLHDKLLILSKSHNKHVYVTNNLNLFIIHKSKIFHFIKTTTFHASLLQDICTIS